LSHNEAINFLCMMYLFFPYPQKKFPSNSRAREFEHLFLPPRFIFSVNDFFFHSSFSPSQNESSVKFESD
jgi:hypothetical protein